MGSKHSTVQRDTESSFKSITKDFSSLKRSRSKNSESTTNLDSNDSTSSDSKILTLIEYELTDYSNSDVFVTGTFTNWTSKLKMNRRDKGKYCLIISLSPGVYQFKFIIDDEWFISEQYPTIHDERGIINNIIDNTNEQYHYIPTKVTNKRPRSSTVDSNKEASPKKEYSSSFEADIMRTLNTIPPEVTDIMIKSISYKNKNTFETQETYKRIKTPMNFFISHLHVSQIVTGSKVTKTMCTCRIRQKMSTIVYYKPCKLNIKLEC